MKSLKKIIIFSITPLLLALCLFLTSSTPKMNANLEVIEVSDFVRFRDISYLYTENYTGDKNRIIEAYLCFDTDDYDAKGNHSSNDYFIISGNEKISPLELKVGDRLFFEIERKIEISPCIIYGKHLYLI